MTQLSLNLQCAEDTLEALCQDLNPEQRQAVMAPVDSAVQVMAGAGTGKTELITRRFAKLTHDLQASGEIDPTARLWVSTFTEKAAQEMKDRIAAYLLRMNGTPLHAKAWVGTFHGLCQRILYQHGDKVPYLKGFTLLTDVELEALQEQLCLQLLQNTVSGWEEILQAEEIACSPVCLSAENLLALNLPDIGTLFSEIVFHLIPRIKAFGLSPKAFWEDAHAQANVYARLIETLPVIDPNTGLLWEQHEQFAQVWHRHLQPMCDLRFSFFPSEWDVEVEALKARRKQKEPPTVLQLLRDNLKPLYQTQCFVSFNGRKKTAPFSPASENFTSLHAALALEQQNIDMVTCVYALYQQTLRRERVCDFDDLIQETIGLLQRQPDVRVGLQKHFAHLMVDEFQDSNGGQLRLMQLLCADDAPKLTVVGDKKQSIYGFRYAEPENLQVLFNPFPQYQTVHLKTNYRSHFPILSVANRVTQMMSLEEDQFLIPPETQNGMAAEPVRWLEIPSDLSAFEAKTVEVRWISETIATLLMNVDYQPQEIAILVRDHQKALQLENALETLGIPAVKQRNLGFFQSPVIQQAVALLELAHDPENDFALINLLQRRLTHRQLYLLAQHRKQCSELMGVPDFSYFETLAHLYHQPHEAHVELTALLPLLHFVFSTINASQLKKEELSPQHLLGWMMQSFPLLPDAHQAAQAYHKARKQLTLFQKMLYYWVEYARKPMTLSEILDFIHRYQAKNDLELPVADAQFEENAVRILTVHGAKGLQFPVVFLAGTDVYRKIRPEGLLTVEPQYPGKLGLGLFLNRHQDQKTLKKRVYDLAWKGPKNQAEELRLFYVAVTRARQRLYISSWPKSFPYMAPSLFQDLPVQVLTEETVAWLTPPQLAEIKQTFQARFYPVQNEPMALSP